jgi:nucleoside-diphosphate-sugar epimerase
LDVEAGENVEVVRGDLRDPTLAAKLIQDMDVVIHMANVKEHKELFLDTNIKGTFYLLDACKEAGNVKQYIQAGSDRRRPPPFRLPRLLSALQGARRGDVRAVPDHVPNADHDLAFLLGA